MRLLLTFPIDPRDPSVIETIADTVYMYSSTMDGRRFAAEFCARRKVDAAAKKGPMITNPATKQNMVAEGELTCSSPRPLQALDISGFQSLKPSRNQCLRSLNGSRQWAGRRSATASSEEDDTKDEHAVRL